MFKIKFFCSSSKSQIKIHIFEFKIFDRLNESMVYVADNINSMLTKFKEDYRNYEKNDENELILICLQNSNELIMRQQLNFLTYAGPI